MGFRWTNSNVENMSSVLALAENLTMQEKRTWILFPWRLAIIGRHCVTLADQLQGGAVATNVGSGNCSTAKLREWRTFWPTDVLASYFLKIGRFGQIYKI